jgi:hypothetical protein
MTRLSQSTVVQKVLVQLGLLDIPVVVLIDELEDGDAVLLGVRLQDVRKVASFGLGRDTETGRTVS